MNDPRATSRPHPIGRIALALCTPFLALLTACDAAPAPAPPSARGEAAGLEAITAPAAGEVHLVRIVQPTGSTSFEPAGLTIRAGEVIRFVMGGSRPVAVVFGADASHPAASQYIRERDFHRGVLLTDPGQLHDVHFEGAPPGRYPFASQPAGAAGVVEVIE